MVVHLLNGTGVIKVDLIRRDDITLQLLRQDIVKTTKIDTTGERRFRAGRATGCPGPAGGAVFGIHYHTIKTGKV